MLKILYSLFFAACFWMTGVTRDLSGLQNPVNISDNSEKIKYWLDLSDYYFHHLANIDSAYKCIIEAEKVAGNLKTNVQIQDKKILVLARMGRVEEAQKLARVALKSAEKMKDNRLSGEILLKIGFLYYLNEENDKAIDAYLKSVANFKKVRDYDGLASSYARIGMVFTIVGDFKEGLNYTLKASQLIPKIKSPLILCSVESSISGLYVQISMKKPEFTDSVIHYAKKSLIHVNEYGILSKGAQLCLSISNAYAIKKIPDSTLFYSLESLRYRQFMFPNEILMSYMNLSDAYLMRKEYKKALLYHDSLQFILKDYKDTYYESALAERGYAINKEMGNLTDALPYLEKWKILSDSLRDADKLERINELEKKYNKAEDEKKIQQLNYDKQSLEQQNELDKLNIRLLIFAIVFFVLLLIVTVFLFRQNALKNKFKVLETEQRLNRARINPHFFFNSLVSLQELAVDTGRSEELANYLAMYARIMRESLESTYNNLNDVENEIAFIKEYLQLQQLRYPGKFDFRIDCKDELMEYAVPSMILQPFVENSIEHGFRSINYKGLIEIIFDITNDDLIIHVRDNGSMNHPKEKSDPSRGTQIITDRLNLINREFKSNARFEIRKESGSFEIIIYLPLLFTE